MREARWSIVKERRGAGTAGRKDREKTSTGTRERLAQGIEEEKESAKSEL